MNGFRIVIAGLFGMALILSACGDRRDSEITILRKGFINPPVEARPRALWDWVDGNFQLEEITREMEKAARMGMGGFDIWDVRRVVDEDSIMPAGPAFMSDEYLEGICHAIHEAKRLGLDLGLIIASGWNAGGAWTLPQHQTMGLFRSELILNGPREFREELNFPELPDMAGKKGREKKAMIPRDSAGLGQVMFDSLVFWNERPEDGIRFFSGIATYEKEFYWKGEGEKLFMEFDDIVEAGRLLLNGQDMGILWKKPFRAEITSALKPGANQIKLEVANAWTYPLEDIPNKEYDLIPAGLTGKVRILMLDN